jgi:hypothetical protein
MSRAKTGPETQKKNHFSTQATPRWALAKKTVKG